MFTGEGARIFLGNSRVTTGFVGNAKSRYSVAGGVVDLFHDWH